MGKRLGEGVRGYEIEGEWLKWEPHVGRRTTEWVGGKGWGSEVEEEPRGICKNLIRIWGIGFVDGCCCWEARISSIRWFWIRLILANEA